MHIQEMPEPSRRILFLKGFKLDGVKIQRYGYHPTEEDPTNTRYYRRITSLIPRTAYKYIGAGVEENGDVCLVVVMEDGWDKEKLQNNDMPFCDGMLAQAAERVMTAGVWPSWD